MNRFRGGLSEPTGCTMTFLTVLGFWTNLFLEAVASTHRSISFDLLLKTIRKPNS